ncbi:hypothetical protein AV530_009065 [Patagioenas fasciata monilis]|uniref:Ig-like domain-containing protein n=1 Tax=Patagioenas fasciata monilis TaxID=372326 RepID=A0A1V4K7A7_PATFA|nr:hypothetical protein AV530_009065 [Patagioenas fasciata monilis]
MAAPPPARHPGAAARVLLSLLCWALVSPRMGAMALQLPHITVLQLSAEPPRLGEKLTVSCEAASDLPEFTLLYWLGNGSFVEKLHQDGAVSEGPVLEEPRGSGVTLLRDLHFSSFSAQHLCTNYTCVVLSPLGVDTRAVRWVPPAPAPSSASSG